MLCTLPVPCEETLFDYFRQLRAVNAIDSGSKHGRGYVYASNGISRRFPRIYSHWAPAYAFHRLLLVDLVPAFALTSYDASLSHPFLNLLYGGLTTSFSSSVLQFHCRCAQCNWPSPGMFHCGTHFRDDSARP